MKTRILLFILVIFGLSACTDASRAKIGGLGSKFKVELIGCDGTVVREWTSTGKVKSEEASDGYYFMDENSGKLIEVTGNLIITKLQEMTVKELKTQLEHFPDEMEVMIKIPEGRAGEYASAGLSEGNLKDQNTDGDPEYYYNGEGDSPVGFNGKVALISY